MGYSSFGAQAYPSGGGFASFGPEAYLRGGGYVINSDQSDQSTFNIFDTALSGMTAERDQMDLIAQNIANINTTQTTAGGPYRRKVALLEEKVPFNNWFVPAGFGGDPFEQQGNLGSGVAVAGVVEDPSPPKLVYDPNNPQANAQGYVAMPNVDLITEMTNMIQANRAYEANAMVAEVNKAMLQKALDLSHYR